MIYLSLSRCCPHDHTHAHTPTLAVTHWFICLFFADGKLIFNMLNAKSIDMVRAWYGGWEWQTNQFIVYTFYTGFKFIYIEFKIKLPFKLMYAVFCLLMLWLLLFSLSLSLLRVVHITCDWINCKMCEKKASESKFYVFCTFMHCINIDN